ncbi:unnamed protein product [Effrenium voratum]|uniref:Uncharacterized protein n=1 Tax=Effrenium voratum TaxID=2562239 RepID=A0AA36MSJ7_9DINO|nr:unnamed protein product [Effrenium voratum]CAJ1378540.1 unnamed protein product [Effrenium voratum]CAJ1460022.1 unnamed protein product [Effrenium voratum]
MGYGASVFIQGLSFVACWPERAFSDLISLQVDLPPDVQRMFEEMCELEGVSQSEMLARWIDARWEAMGYKDSDLEILDKEPCDSKADSSSASCSKDDRGSANTAQAEFRPSGKVHAEADEHVGERKLHDKEESTEDEEEEEDAVPDIDTWMRRYGSSEPDD